MYMIAIIHVLSNETRKNVNWHYHEMRKNFLQRCYSGLNTAVEHTYVLLRLTDRHVFMWLTPTFLLEYNYVNLFWNLDFLSFLSFFIFQNVSFVLAFSIESPFLNHYQRFSIPFLRKCKSIHYFLFKFTNIIIINC